MGLRNAMHILTFLLAPLVAQLLRGGLRCLIYIDYFFLAAASKQLALVQEKRVVWQVRLGFKLAKRSEELWHVCKFLGLEVNSWDFTFNNPADKLEKIKSRMGLVKKQKGEGPVQGGGHPAAGADCHSANPIGDDTVTVHGSGEGRLLVLLHRARRDGNV